MTQQIATGALLLVITTVIHAVAMRPGVLRNRMGPHRALEAAPRLDAHHPDGGFRSPCSFPGSWKL
jgi:hypothetical protein